MFAKLRLWLVGELQNHSAILDNNRDMSIQIKGKKEISNILYLDISQNKNSLGNSNYEKLLRKLGKLVI